jgi:hypothetical protein
MTNFKPPTASQMTRFRKLVSERRIGRTSFEEFLDLAEFGTEPAPLVPATEEERRALRMRWAEAGTSYSEAMFPFGTRFREGSRLRNILATEHRYYRDSRVSDDRIHVRTIKDLVAMSEAQAAKMKNIGAKSVEALKARLAMAGLRLGMQPDQIGRAFDFGEAPVSPHASDHAAAAP